VTVRRVTVRPIPQKELGALLRDHLGTALPRPLVAQLHEVSGGNPFYALEIARALERQGARPDPGERLPVPDDLQQLLGARLAALPTSSGKALLTVAATARPTEDLVLAVAGRRRTAGRSRGGGSRERHPSRRGSIRFTHLLLDRPSTPRPHHRRSAAFTAGWRTWSSTSRSGLAPRFVDHRSGRRRGGGARRRGSARSRTGSP
jgi:hypothetical protein